MAVRPSIHVGVQAEIRGIPLEFVRQCCLDPDREERTRLRSWPWEGTLFTREFREGVVSVVTRSDGDVIVVITAFWRRPRKRRRTRQERPR